MFKHKPGRRPVCLVSFRGTTFPWSWRVCQLCSAPHPRPVLHIALEFSLGALVGYGHDIVHTWQLERLKAVFWSSVVSSCHSELMLGVCIKWLSAFFPAPFCSWLVCSQSWMGAGLIHHRRWEGTQRYERVTVHISCVIPSDFLGSNSFLDVRHPQAPWALEPLSPRALEPSSPQAFKPATLAKSCLWWSCRRTSCF